MSRPAAVGLVSDTHGLLRPEALRALRGSDAIIHAGDVGDPALLNELARLAPVTVVRGNVDQGAWAASLPETAVLEIGGARIYVVHNIDDLDIDPVAAGFAAVIYGHSHQPGMREKDGVLYVNPGSAGPRRFSLPISAGRLAIADGKLSVELIELMLDAR
jgi:putative phosphoesterase